MANATYADLLGSDMILHYDASDASSLFTDTGASTAAVDGDEVKAITPQAEASLSVNLTGSTGPIYRANYSATGYAALQFDGVNDRLGNATPGLSAERFFVICAYTFISGTASTVWMRGSYTRLARVLYNGAATQLQIGISGAYVAISLPVAAAGKSVVATEVSDEGMIASSVYSVVGSVGDRLDNLMPDGFYVGAAENGGTFQPLAMAFHELIYVGANCEWGQVLRASKVMRNKWGIADPNALPQTAGGTAGFTGIRGLSRRLGT